MPSAVPQFYFIISVLHIAMPLKGRQELREARCAVEHGNAATKAYLACGITVWITMQSCVGVLDHGDHSDQSRECTSDEHVVDFKGDGQQVVLVLDDWLWSLLFLKCCIVAYRIVVCCWYYGPE